MSFFSLVFRRKLLYLGSSYWSEKEMRIHLLTVPDSCLEAALRALNSFKLKIEMSQFCKTLERALLVTLP